MSLLPQCKNEIPHTTNFVPLLELAKSIGATYIGSLDLDGNAHYTSERFIQEAVISLGGVIKKEILSEVRLSPFFALMCDETTDVAIKKELIVYAHYLGSDRQVHTAFIGMVEVPDGCAKTLFDALNRLCEDESLDIKNKLVAFGSDGAAVMIGARSGVATIFKQNSPWLIANHCIAHRLALASAQAADEVPYVKKFKAILDQLYRFYDNSAVRTAALKLIQDVLNHLKLKLTQAKDVRWLSHERAVGNLCKCLPSVIVSLEGEANERHDAQALGLATFVKTYKFVATLLMLSDTTTSSIFVQGISTSRPRLYPGQALGFWHHSHLTEPEAFSRPFFPSLHTDSVLQGDLDSVDIRSQGTDKDVFTSTIYNKYLDAVDTHLKRRFPDLDLLEAISVFDGRNWPESLENYGQEHLGITVLLI